MGLAFSCSTAVAGESVSTIEGLIRSTVQPFADFLIPLVFAPIWGTNILWIVAWLIIASLVFTVYFRGIQFRAFNLALDIVRGRYSDPNSPGEVSHFQALTAALSGTVGLGNIAGVAVAISVGGPGATLWMIVAGFMGMASKFVECTLGVKYRVAHADGSFSGGPHVLLKLGLNRERVSYFR